MGLTCGQEFVDPAKLERAIAAVPAQRRAAAYRRYQIDPRDSATPEAMTKLLITLVEGRVLAITLPRTVP